jgi:hypothetical protein
VRRLLFLLLLTLIAVPLFALDAAPAQQPTNLVDDVIRMSKAGVPEDAIIAFVHKADGRVDVTANDLIALTEANVSKAVIKAVVDEADMRDGSSRDRDRYRERDVRTRVVVAPPYYWDPWYYDPFWYAPRLSIGFGVGFGHYGGRGYYRGGGHFRHR